MAIKFINGLYRIVFNYLFLITMYSNTHFLVFNINVYIIPR